MKSISDLRTESKKMSRVLKILIIPWILLGFVIFIPLACGNEDIFGIRGIRLILIFFVYFSIPMFLLAHIGDLRNEIMRKEKDIEKGFWEWE